MFTVTDPLISIITPTYNHEKFIGKCLESVLSQSYSNWEQIIVDDGSRDRTGEIISQYKDERIRYIWQENKGILRLSEIYNMALHISKGEYIAILEGDDFWPSNKLEVQTEEMRRADAVLSWGKAQIVDSEGNSLALLPNDVKRFKNKTREQQLSSLLFGNPMHSCTIVCRKDSLLSMGGFKQPNGIPYVDGPTWLELSLKGKFLPIDCILGCYRRHGNQITSVMKTSMVRAGRYSIEFYKNLPSEIQSALAQEVGDIDARLGQRLREMDYYLGRAYLGEGSWQDARENFLKAIKEKNASSIKAKAFLGIICGLCRIDMEKLAALYDSRNGSI